MRITDEEVKNRKELEKKLSNRDEVPEEFSIAAEAIIFDQDKQWLLMKRGPACRDEIGKLEGIGGSVEEQDETFQDTVKREIREEAGDDVEVEIIDFFEVRKDTVEPAQTDEDEKHWIIISFICKLKSGDPKIIEPEKNSGYYRKNTNEVDPKKLSSSSKSAFQSLKKNWDSIERKLRDY